MNYNKKEKTNRLLDFHTHSDHSDGGDNIRKLIENAKLNNIDILALTDHNTIVGLPEFNFLCKKERIIPIPFGAEIYAEIPKEILSTKDNETPDFVILGKNARIKSFLTYREILMKDRKFRFIPESINKLKNLGFKIPSFDVDFQSQLSVPSIFHDLLNYSDNIHLLYKQILNITSEITYDEIKLSPIRFMNQYIYALNRPGYIKRLSGFGIDKAIELAEEMNCRLFIAHPGGPFGFLSDKVIQYCIQQGVHGIEVRNYFNSSEQNKKFDHLVNRYSLLKSGGSDYHGNNGISKIGIFDRPENQLPISFIQLLDELP